MAGGKVHSFSGFTMSVCQLRPESRGYVRIQSADPLTPPKMVANYLATQHDRDTSVAASVNVGGPVSIQDKLTVGGRLTGIGMATFDSA
ncbi:hypothetical protein EBU60_06825, partial [bacterium]|nr:hypothetical protein [bacterium]